MVPKSMPITGPSIFSSSFATAQASKASKVSLHMSQNRRVYCPEPSAVKALPLRPPSHSTEMLSYDILSIN